MVNVARDIVGNVGFPHSRRSDGGSVFFAALPPRIRTLLDVLDPVDTAAAALVVGEGGRGRFSNLIALCCWFRATLPRFPRLEALEDVDDEGDHEEHPQDDGERVRGRASPSGAAPNVHLVPLDVVVAEDEVGVVDALCVIVEEPVRWDAHGVLQGDEAATLAAYPRAFPAASYVHARVVIRRFAPPTVLLEVLTKSEVVMVFAEEFDPVHFFKVTQLYSSHASD